MTEDEAKTKWCPFARGPLLVKLNEWTTLPVNRDDTGGPDGGCKCLGSACMAWRAQYEWNDAANTIDATGGYCGLAGRA